MSTLSRSRRVVMSVAAVVVLAALSTVAVAAATGAFTEHRVVSAADRCTAPTLPGAVVSVRLVDMRAMMGRTPMMGGHGPLMSQRDWRSFRPGMMRLLADPA